MQWEMSDFPDRFRECANLLPIVAAERRHHVQEFTDLVPPLHLMAHGASGVDLVAIAPTDPDAFQVAAGLELTDDLRDGPVGDADQLGQIPQTELGVAGQTDQDVGVVGEERPRRVVTDRLIGSSGLDRVRHHRNVARTGV